MDVIVNTDHNITLTEKTTGDIASQVETALGHFTARLTRVEVHLSDESPGRSTDNDIRCRLEARPEGLSPEFVTDSGSTVDEAVGGAAKKLRHVLDTTFGRLGHRKGNTPMGGPEPS